MDIKKRKAEGKIIVDAAESTPLSPDENKNPDVVDSHKHITPEDIENQSPDRDGSQKQNGQPEIATGEVGLQLESKKRKAEGKKNVEISKKEDVIDSESQTGEGNQGTGGTPGEGNQGADGLESKKRKAKKHFTLAERLKVIEVIESGQMSLCAIARQFEVDEKTIRNIKKGKESLKERISNLESNHSSTTQKRSATKAQPQQPDPAPSSNDGPKGQRQLKRTPVSSKTLKTVIFLGSSRTVSPFWGEDARLGDRVLNWVRATLSARNEPFGKDTIQHQVEIFDEQGALAKFTSGQLSAKTYLVSEHDLPQEVKALKQTIVDADCYLIVSPEYNHAAPTALTSLMGYFGGSCYKCKPAGIVTYSAGPWGGMRAAMNIQGGCHELGCLPVSKLCGIPTVAQLIDENGVPKDPQDPMLKQLPEMLTQLEWMAVAMKRQRDDTGSF